MDPTAKLLRVFLVDRQLRGLTSRLRAADSFATEQERQLNELTAREKALEGQLRQIKASSANQETEIAGLDQKVATLRERMNTTQTNKEYQALLTEANTHKAQRDALEQDTISLMQKAEELQAQLAQIAQSKAERQTILSNARSARDERQAEVKDRLEELTAERAQLITQVPKDALARYEDRWHRFGEPEDVMATVDEQDRRRGEYTCSSCMMSVPIETVNALLSHGGITGCVSCGVLLYLDSELQDALKAKGSKVIR